MQLDKDAQLPKGPAVPHFGVEIVIVIVSVRSSMDVELFYMPLSKSDSIGLA